MSTVSIPSGLVQSVPALAVDPAEIIADWLIENSAEAVELLQSFRTIHGEEKEAVASFARSVPFLASRCWRQISDWHFSGSMIHTMSYANWQQVAQIVAARWTPEDADRLLTIEREFSEEVNA